MSAQSFEPIVLEGHVGIGPAVEATALVAADNFSARYDLDRRAGIFSRPTHALHGQSYVDRILVLNGAKGGVATAWMLHEMAARAMAPRGLVLNAANPIMAQGAAFANLPFIDRFAVDITAEVRTGDRVRLDPGRGTLTILARG